MGKKRQLLTAYGFILNKDNQLLLVQRAPHDTHPGLWELPGGAVEHHENPEEATIREVQEEAGLEIELVKKLATITGTSSKGYPVSRSAYLCKMTDDTQPVILSEEHSQYQWTSLEKKPDVYLSKLVEYIYQEKENLGL